MQTLPASFQALANYKQFVIWQAIPNKKKPGKFDKITVNPRTLFNHNAHDPAIWMDAVSAIDLVGRLGGSYGVGFVFTKTDPFWFFDLDNCTVDGQWRQDVVDFCQYFAGCAIEISMSGHGLHIIGAGVQSIITEHAKKNVPLGIEFYTDNRFCALTGNGATGDAGFNASHLLPQFIAQYFPPKTPTIKAEWTTKPHPDSRPLKTDKALIKRMCESTSAKSIFSQGVSVADLWNAVENKLAIAYPAFNETDPFDRSSADQALCNHLAFWTGKDCERIDRLMRQSSLVRDKWTDRQTYRQDTILKAVAACQAVYGSQIAAKEAAQSEWKPEQHITNTTIKANGGASIVPYEERPAYFAGHFFLTKSSRVFCPDSVVRAQTDYNSMYSIVEFAEPFGGKPIEDAWKAYVTATDMTRAEVYDTAYRPEYDFGITFNDGGRVYVNEYVNQDGKRIEGDVTPFIDHIKLLLPNGRDAEILLCWMAALIQYPGKKFFWSPFLQGIEGNGKSLIARILSYCIGVDHVEDVDPEDFCNSGGKFNKYVSNHRLAVLEEIKVGSRNQAEGALKRFIGNNRIQIQGKGVDQTTIETCINWLLMSNHKDAIHITDYTRRFAILFCAQQEGSDLTKLDMQRGGRYFRQLFDWFYNKQGWGIVANFLREYQIAAEFNPATDADKAPMTTSFMEAVNESKSNPHLAIIECMTSGKPGTLKGWLSIQALRLILQSDYGMKPPSGKMMAKYLKAEGYVKHPALTNQGRATKPIFQENNNRSVIYVREDSIQFKLTDGVEVTEQYLKAQGYVGQPQTGVNQNENQDHKM